MDIRHRFIDANGNEIIGKSEVRNTWKNYFKVFPDYRIEIEDIYSKNFKLAVFGFASGTLRTGIHSNNKLREKNEFYWKIPASWKIVVKKKVKLWQVYADTKVPSDIIKMYQ